MIFGLGKEERRTGIEGWGGRRAPPAQQHPDFFSCLGGMIGNASLSAGTVALGNFWAAMRHGCHAYVGEGGRGRIGCGIRQRSTGRRLIESFITALAREGPILQHPPIDSSCSVMPVFRPSTRGLDFLLVLPGLCDIKSYLFAFLPSPGNPQNMLKDDDNRYSSHKNAPSESTNSLRTYLKRRWRYLSNPKRSIFLAISDEEIERGQTIPVSPTWRDVRSVLFIYIHTCQPYHPQATGLPYQSRRKYS